MKFSQIYGFFFQYRLELGNIHLKQDGKKKQTYFMSVKIVCEDKKVFFFQLTFAFLGTLMINF